MRTLVIATLLTFFVSNASFAQNSTPRIDTRQHAQRGRIMQGRASGELTNGEAALLNRQQRHIRRSERRANADGTVTRSEQRQIDRQQNRASRNIRRAKHNRIDKI